tara:strand:+ start:84 stop:1064 length:981 start_codon:yes stop_codon:yes gene_type:complete
MLQNPVINGLFSIFLILVLCVLLGIPNKDIFVILVVSIVVIFVFNLINEMNKYYNNRINNIVDPEILLTRVNNIYNTSQNKSINIIDEEPKVIDNNSPSPSLSDNTNFTTFDQNSNSNNFNVNIDIENNNINKKNNRKPYHLQNSPDNIIDANKYNLEDCTTDKSCLIQEDENNLYPGFDKKKNSNIYTVKNPINIKISVLPKKMNNRLSIEENVIVEKFTNHKTPNDLNDIVKPFNKTVISPYEEMSILEKKNNICRKIKNDTNDLCRHCKVGECSNGVCVDKNELKYGLVKEIPSKIISDSIKDVHPFSSDFQTIRTTNPESVF